MKSLPWLRLYTEIIDDEKLGLLAFEDRWHFVALLCLKGKGVLDTEPDAELLARKVALKMGLTCAELEKVAKRLSRMGLIDCESFQPLAWDERQFSSDQDGTAAVRQKRFRESRKSNALRNADSNAPVTRLDTEADTDTEPDKQPAVVKRASKKCPADFEITSDMRTWASLECPTVDADKATAKFRDHTFKTAMTDWVGAWRNWLRRDAESSFGRRPAAAMTASNRQAESFAERDARNGREAWERMTGRQWPADELPGARPAAPFTIDIESTEIKRLSK